MSSQKHYKNSRRAGFAEPKRVIMIYSEGEVTEPHYLKQISQLFGASVSLNFAAEGGDPRELINKARRNKPRRRSHQSRDLDYLEVWAIFDDDERGHEYITQVLREAKKIGVKVAFSNPCFELWILLHEVNQTAEIDCDKAGDKAKECGLIKGKIVPKNIYSTLQQNYETAKKRAQDLDRKHEQDGSGPRANPSTNVWELVDRLRP